MITIRNNTFETNSSSTHSMVICTEEQYKLLKDEAMLIHCWNDEFVKVEDLRTEIINEHPQIIKDDGIVDEDMLESYKSRYETLDEWIGDLECDSTTFIDSAGKKYIIVCKFGYNG